MGNIMVDLSTTYLGLEIRNPLVAAASPLSKKLDSVRRLEDAGVGALVMYSLFEEQIIHESRELDFFLNQGTESYAEAITYFPEMPQYNVGPEAYLERIQEYKKAVHMPIIASLNGISTGGWVKYAKMMEEAGADGLELNIYHIPTDPAISSQELEQAYFDLVRDVRKQVHIPLAVKLGAYFTSFPNLAARLVDAGVNALVLFNRFYQPDLNLTSMAVEPSLELSDSADLRLPLRWVAILYQRIKTEFAITSGVHTGSDMAKALLAGAQVAQVASELIVNGPARALGMLEELTIFMDTRKYKTIDQMRGSLSQQHVAQPAAFERANYMKALNSFD
jgi:dihydroorotate dehydrogenase (fumarate)